MQYFYSAEKNEILCMDADEKIIAYRALIQTETEETEEEDEGLCLCGHMKWDHLHAGSPVACMHMDCKGCLSFKKPEDLTEEEKRNLITVDSPGLAYDPEEAPEPPMILSKEKKVVGGGKTVPTLDSPQKEKLSPEEEKEKRAAYMRKYYAKKKAEKEGREYIEGEENDHLIKPTNDPIVRQEITPQPKPVIPVGLNKEMIEKFGLSAVEEIVDKMKAEWSADDIYYGDTKHTGFLSIDQIQKIIDSHKHLL